MVENSIPWGGIVTGDHGPYTDDQWSDMQRKLFQTDRTVDGVVAFNSSELLVTNPAGATIRVAPGAALVDGKFYESDANNDFVIALVPGNKYRVVLRKDFAAQTVRAVLLGPGGVTPALTQTDGVVWEIPLAFVNVNAGPTVYVGDERDYVSYTNPVIRREGGSSTDWNTPGNISNYIKPAFIQCGAIAIPMPFPGSQDAGPETITFPKSFAHKPLIFVTYSDNGSGDIAYAYVNDASITVAQFQVYARAEANFTATVLINWIAIGPLL